jgi:hypothetical protein
MTVADWPEEKAKAAIRERSGGICEITGTVAGDASHRMASGRGGPWNPVNLIHMSRAAHALCHGFPTRAHELGWFVRTGADPREVPVWLLTPYPGWWLLVDADDGGPHLLFPLDEDDLADRFGVLYTDPASGEIRIPVPPRWYRPQGGRPKPGRPTRPMEGPHP